MDDDAPIGDDDYPTDEDGLTNADEQHIVDVLLDMLDELSKVRELLRQLLEPTSRPVLDRQISFGKHL
jgi:hypothetical protein